MNGPPMKYPGNRYRNPGRAAAETSPDKSIESLSISFMSDYFASAFDSTRAPGPFSASTKVSVSFRICETNSGEAASQ